MQTNTAHYVLCYNRREPLEELWEYHGLKEGKRRNNENRRVRKIFTQNHQKRTPTRFGHINIGVKLKRKWSQLSAIDLTYDDDDDDNNGDDDDDDDDDDDNNGDDDEDDDDDDEDDDDDDNGDDDDDDDDNGDDGWWW